MTASPLNLTQVLPLYAAVCPELTTYLRNGLAHKTRDKYMANGILKQLNQSLEITVQDGLDGLADFTLQLAYASNGGQFEILSIGNANTKPPSLKLVESATEDTAFLPTIRRQQRH